MSDVRVAIRSEASRLEDDILFTEKSHFAASNSNLHLHYCLGSVSAISSAIAAATVFVELAVMTGLAALIGAVVAGVLTILNPQEAAKQHLDTGRKLTAVRTSLRHLREIDALDSSSVDDRVLREQLGRLTEEKGKIDFEALSISERAYKKGSKKAKGN